MVNSIQIFYLKLKNVSTFDLNQEKVANSLDNKLISMQFLTESNNISLINSKGDLYLLNVMDNEVIMLA